MNEQQVADAVHVWVLELLTPLGLANSYPYMAAIHDTLPDAMIEVERKSTEMNSPDFPFSAVQQRILRVFSVSMNIMVESNVGADYEADRIETEMLRGYGAEIERSVLSDATLGGRVFMVSPLMEFDYTLPFVEYPDGTRGRQMQVSLAVGELVDEEDSVV